MEHILYIAVTLAVGVLIGWKTYPSIHHLIESRKRDEIQD